MISKFETRSNRVKGVSFHPSRPWILASLHNGVIQLWDYRIKTLLDRFDEHDGPVRGICFHQSQPIFVSGGDDYKIKVWNYKQRRCLFTLLGHLDYIRTVQFHHEYPWILSSSDDQTVRVWNWQSRQVVAVLTGHNHYVMCASFHPKEDLIVSASLDQTIRVWDISGLRKKNSSPGEPTLPLAQSDLFGNLDVTVKYVLEGHDRGVNWAAFHHSLPLLVSGSDDRQLKLWRMNESKAWEVDTLRGHFNNVSCVLFHPKQEIILSNSEDKTIRVWDMSKRAGVQTFRREHDRFWVLAAHPQYNLFAAGHDSGMVVFKLDRERPPHSVTNTASGRLLHYIAGRYLRQCNFSTGVDVPVLSVRRSASNSRTVISYNPVERAILISDTEGGFYDLYGINPSGSISSHAPEQYSESKRAAALVALWISRDRFAVLEKSRNLLIKNLKNEVVKRCQSPVLQYVDMMFPATTGFLLLRSEDKIILFDVQQKRSVAELSTSTGTGGNNNPIKHVYWSTGSGYNLVALVGRDGIIIANRKLEQLAVIHERTRVKSGCWDESGHVFIYNTLNHLKYTLPNGDNGIIRTWDTPVYLTSEKGGKVACLDRDCKRRTILIDPAEYTFKLALLTSNYSEIPNLLKKTNLPGQAIIAYLQKQGYPEVGLHFVKDEKTRFNLALECGNIDVALDSARLLDDKDCWSRLAHEALRQGNHQVVEMAYQKTKNFERLSFLYLITGNVEKLKKMLKISEFRNDSNSRFHNALYLGDVPELVRLLEEVGQVPLAYMTATVYNLTEQIESLKAKFSNGNYPEIPQEGRTLLNPPTPILRLQESTWPLLTTTPTILSSMASKKQDAAFATTVETPDNAWGEDDVQLPDEGQQNIPEDDVPVIPETSEGDGWDQLEIEGIENIPVNTTTASDNYFVPPQRGPSFSQFWTRNSRHPSLHVAAGSFETAMKLMNQQFGVVNFEPLKEHFMKIYMSSRIFLRANASAPELTLPLLQNWKEAIRPSSIPQLHVSLSSLISRLKSHAYRATTEGKFTEAIQHFLFILHCLPFLVFERKQTNDVVELLTICREYVSGIRMELKRKELATGTITPESVNGGKPIDSAVRQTELAAYFTHCALQPAHLLLSLRSAMNCAYKVKNYKMSASFGRRLLELNPKPEIAAQARKVIKFCESNSTDQHELDYHERNPFVICGISLKPIYKGTPHTKCPLCKATFAEQFNGQLCTICQLSQIGSSAQGLTHFESLA